MQKKIVVLDIDGTLTNSKKQITEATKKSLWSIMKQGHKVILASGRPTPGMRRYESELELSNYGGYLLSFNGGKIVDCKTGEIVFQRVLPKGIHEELYGFAKENGCGLITYRNDVILSAFEPDEYVQLEARINGLEVEVVENFVEVIDFDLNKCLLTAAPERAEVLEKELQNQYKDALSIYRSEPFFIEVMPNHVDKAASLDRMINGLGWSQTNTICCGDGFNDLSMIRYGNVGVAMGNAQPAVKEAADYITGTNDEDGLVEVIDKFVWNKAV